MGAGVIACDILGSEVQLSPRKDHFRDVSAEKVFALRLWNREKFETWPKSCAPSRMDRDGEARHIFKTLSKDICNVKEIVCDFFPPQI